MVLKSNPLKSNPMVKKVVEAGEARVGKIAGQLLSNERFVVAIQTIVSRSLQAKGTLDKSLRTALATMNLPSTGDVEKVREKLDDIDRLLTDLDGKMNRLEQRLEARTASAASSPSSSTSKKEKKSESATV